MFWLVLAVCHQVIISQSQIEFNNESFGCNCKLLTECDPINELVKAQKFTELRNNHKSCGFDRKIPKYCCPLSPDQKAATTTETPIEVVPRFDDNESENVINAIFETKGSHIDKKVVCGGHQADSCAQCPMDIGESWCNGECAWCEGKCQIKGKNCGKSPEGFSADLTKAKEDLFSVLNEKCGVASGDQQEFIFGGTETGDHAYPWMAGLAYKLPGMDSANVFCGGVIISSNVIATAGHCLSESMVSVKVGHADLALASSFDVESMVAHPNNEKNHNRMGPINDIALIKLSEHLEFDEKIAPICLPQNHTEDDLVDEDKTLLVVAGWGTTENDTSSDKLLELFLEYKKSAVCESEFQSQTGISEFKVQDSQICAAGELGSDSCKGDSGGPLMRLDVNEGKYEVIGLTSFGNKNCDSATPGFYTRVYNYLPWITDFMVKSSIK